MKNTGINLEKVRIRNRASVLSCVRARGQVSRKEIAQATGLTPASVTQICGDLLEESFASSHRLRRLWIEYKKELPLGARTALTFALEDGTLFVRGFHDDKEAFSARCEYDPV